jgi:hypothetical protein
LDQSIKQSQSDKYSAEKEVWRGIEEGLTAVIVNPSVIFGAGNWEEILHESGRNDALAEVEEDSQ